MTPNLFSAPASNPAPAAAPVVATPSKLVPARAARFPTTCPGCTTSIPKGAPYWFAPQGATNAKAWCVACGEAMTGAQHHAAAAQLDPRDGHPADVPTQPQARTLPPPPPAAGQRVSLPEAQRDQCQENPHATPAQDAPVDAQEAAGQDEPDWTGQGDNAQDAPAQPATPADPLAAAIARAVEPLLARATAGSLDEDAARKVARAELAAALRRLRRAGAQDATPESVTWVPKASPDYDGDNTTSRALAACIATGSHAFVSGPSGSGKTFPALQEAARLGRPVVYLSCSEGMDRASLLGSWILTVGRDGRQRMTFAFGPLPRAMASGAVLVVDEADKMAAALSAVLFGVTDPKDPQPLYIPENGATIEPAPGFVVVATGNTLRDETGVYSGQRPDAALVNRMLQIPADYLPLDREARILERHAPSPSDAQRIARALVSLRKLHDAGQCDAPPSLRTGVVVAGLLAGKMPSGQPAPTRLSWADAWSLAFLGSLTPSQHKTAAGALGL